MTFEKSCGAIIIKIEGAKIYTLLIQMWGGHWSFPKGHVENNETEIETAKREIKEETNLDVVLDTRFREVSTYSPKINVIKDVVFFIGIAKCDNVINQASEVKDSKWVEITDALNLVTFENDRKILKSAIIYINNHFKEKNQ